MMHVGARDFMRVVVVVVVDAGGGCRQPEERVSCNLSGQPLAQFTFVPLD